MISAVFAGDRLMAGREALCLNSKSDNEILRCSVLLGACQVKERKGVKRYDLNIVLHCFNVPTKRLYF